MGLVSKSLTVLSALAGLAVFSQAPEFAQQYRQRIGGAVDELKTIVVDFDKDAAASKLSRSQALDQLKMSNEQFSNDRGISMTRSIGRYQRLNKQMVWLEKSHPITRPLLVLKNPDGKLIERAWQIFEPAVPMTGPGALYGGIGALLAMMLARFGIGGGRKIGQRRKKASDASKIPLLTEVDAAASKMVPSEKEQANGNFDITHLESNDAQSSQSSQSSQPSQPSQPSMNRMEFALRPARTTTTSRD